MIEERDFVPNPERHHIGWRRNPECGCPKPERGTCDCDDDGIEIAVAVQIEDHVLVPPLDRHRV